MQNFHLVQLVSYTSRSEDFRMVAFLRKGSLVANTRFFGTIYDSVELPLHRYVVHLNLVYSKSPHITPALDRCA